MRWSSRAVSDIYGQPHCPACGTPVDPSEDAFCPAGRSGGRVCAVPLLEGWPDRAMAADDDAEGLYNVDGSCGYDDDSGAVPRCPACRQAVRAEDGGYCPSCLTVLPDSVLDQLKAQLGQPADDRGRPRDGRRSVMTPGEQAQYERSRYLQSLPQERSFSRWLDGRGGDGRTLNEMITEAEELVAVTERAWAEASTELRDRSYHARHQHLAERSGSLTPAERAEYVGAMDSLAHWQRCEQEYEAARSRLDHLLGQWDEASNRPVPGRGRNQIFRPRPDGLRRDDLDGWPHG